MKGSRLLRLLERLVVVAEAVENATEVPARDGHVRVLGAKLLNSARNSVSTVYWTTAEITQPDALGFQMLLHGLLVLAHELEQAAQVANRGATTSKGSVVEALCFVFLSFIALFDRQTYAKAGCELPMCARCNCSHCSKWACATSYMPLLLKQSARLSAN